MSDSISMVIQEVWLTKKILIHHLKKKKIKATTIICCKIEKQAKTKQNKIKTNKQTKTWKVSPSPVRGFYESIFDVMQLLPPTFHSLKHSSANYRRGWKMPWYWKNRTRVWTVSVPLKLETSLIYKWTNHDTLVSIVQ